MTTATAPEPTEPPLPADLSPSSPLLNAKLCALRRRHVSVQAMTGMAMAIVVGIELLALAMFLDWWIELPWGLRLLSLVVQLGVFTYLSVRFVLAPVLRQPDEDELAL